MRPKEISNKAKAVETASHERHSPQLRSPPLPAIIFPDSPFADFSPHLPRNKVSALPQGV